MAQQFHLPLPLIVSLGIEDFMPSEANEQAVHWLIQSTPAQWSSHALILWAPSGCGKTHLLNIWKAQANAIEASPDNNALEKLLSGEEKAKGYTIDDADALTGTPEHEEWLQHFYNATKTAKTPVLLASQTPPAQWGLALPDILTRLKSCQTVALQEPDDFLIRGLLMKLFRDRQLLIDAGVVEYIAARLERTGNAVRDAVNKLDEASLENKRKISKPFAQQVLGWK